MTTLITNYGDNYHTDKLLRNTPAWWDKTPRSGDQKGSNFYSLLSAIGAVDWALGGHEPMVYVAEGTGVGTAGVFTVSGAAWEVNEFRGYLLEDADLVNHKRKVDAKGDILRYEIASNTADTLTLVDSTVTPTTGAFRILRPCSAMSEVRYDVQIRTAEYVDLDVKGRNVGVPRLKGGLTDTLYRKLIPLLSWGPKLYRPAIENVVAALLGVKGVDWNLFEINQREFIIEIYKSSLLPDGIATYLQVDQNTALTSPYTNPVPGYAATDFQQARPSVVNPVYMAGTFVLTDGTVVDEEFIRQVLTTYCKAAGVRVLVDFVGE